MAERDYEWAELQEEKAAYPEGEGRRIQVEHDGLRASMDRLGKASEMLLSRLEKVVQPEMDASVVPMESKPTADVPTSPLAARLLDDRRNIDRIVRRIESACARLEL